MQIPRCARNDKFKSEPAPGFLRASVSLWWTASLACGGLVGADEVFDAVDVHLGEVNDGTTVDEQVGGVVEREPEGAQDSERHHGRAVDAGRAVDVEPVLGIVEGGEREFDAALEEL